MRTNRYIDYNRIVGYTRINGVIEMSSFRNKKTGQSKIKEMSHAEKMEKLEEELQDIANSLYEIFVDIGKTEDIFWEMLKASSLKNRENK